MSRVISALALGGALVLSPLLAWQLLHLRKNAPRLGDADGPTSGTFPGEHPELNVLLVGDSTVAGVGARNHNEGLAGQTAEALNRITGRAVHWRAAGTSGATAQSLVERLPDNIDKEPDLIVLSIGTNDAVRLRPSWTWSKRLDELVAVLREQYGNAPILFAGLPPLEHFPALPTPLAQVIGVSAKALNRAANERAATHNAMDCLAFRKDLDLSLFASDGFHPGPGAYSVWGEDLASLAVTGNWLNDRVAA